MTLTTQQLLEQALAALDRDGPSICAAHVSHALDLLKRHSADRAAPRAAGQPIRFPGVP